MKRLSPTSINAMLLQKLQAYDPSHQRKMWEYTAGRPHQFKSALTTALLTEQSRRCAYCGERIFGVRPHRDHIAPRQSHPEYTFVPENLVLACYYCNEECKLATDTVAAKGKTYQECAFSIIHPYFDEPSEHIEFVGGKSQLLIQVVAGSQKGQRTIELFELDSPERSKQRVKDALVDDDLGYLTGPWRDAVECAISSRIKTTLKP